MSDLTITLKHVLTVPYFHRRRGLCRSGARNWFARHGLDWASFKREGIAAETLLATGDAFALAVVEWARQCEHEAAVNG